MHTTSRALARACSSLLLGVAIVPAAFGAQDWHVAGKGVLDAPAGIAVHDGSIYVADFNHHRVEVFSLGGDRRGGWGGYGATPGRFHGPSGIAIGTDGRVYVTDFYNHRVQVFTSEGRFLDQWGRYGDDEGHFRGPIGIAIGRDGVVHVSDVDNHRVQRFSAEGAHLSTWGSHGSGDGELIDPWGIAAGPSGDIFVADHGNHRVQRYSPNGESHSLTTVAAPDEGGLLGPVALTTGLDGAVYVSDLVTHRVLRFQPDGSSSSLPSATGSHGLRFGLALDGDVLLATNAGRDWIERTRVDQFEPGATASVPTHFSLSRAWPNPSRGTTLLRFGLPSSGSLDVEIFGVDGRRVRAFGNVQYSAGETLVRWNGSTDGGRPAGPGIYFVRGRFDDGQSVVTTTGRIVLLQ